MNEYLIDYRSIVRLVLKLTGLALVVFGVVQFASLAPMTFLSHFGEEMAPDWLLFSAAPLVKIFFGILLWLFSAPVTNTLFRFQADGPDGYPSWLERVEVIGISLLGLWLAFRSISDLIYHLLSLRQRGMPSQLDFGHADFGPYFVATLVELVIALFFIFGARGIAQIVGRYRRSYVIPGKTR